MKVQLLNSGDIHVIAEADVVVRLHTYTLEADLRDPAVRAYWEGQKPDFGEVSENVEVELKITFSVVLAKSTHGLMSADLLALSGDAQSMTYNPPLFIMSLIQPGEDERPPPDET